MTLSLHKLWGGSGYEYLTQQVARLDATHAGGPSLASYYAERGESPGLWLGAGMVGIEGLAVGDVVTAEQMEALFGRGGHPLASERERAAKAARLDPRAVRSAGRLGSPFPSPPDGASALDREVGRRLAAGGAEQATCLEPGSEARATLRSVVAAEWFAGKFGRPPVDGRELAGAVARWSRRPAQPVAGYDLTFSPVKSVSALWAVAPPPVAAQVERAHRAAVADALEFLERDALYTREGAQGVRQVGVVGLVAAAFTHRDSRAGDPDLHTHVAVANKVQTREGKWLAIDGRVLFAATVAASETYNTALERHLGERLGLRFADRSRTDGRRCVREVVGVDPGLIEVWSSRRTAIDVRRSELTHQFHARHGRPPSRTEAHTLAQQATLETRPAKHEPRTLAEQRSTWAQQASQVLGGAEQVRAMVDQALSPAAVGLRPLDAAWVARTAAAVVATLEAERATWGRWHLHAEALRQVRSADQPDAPMPAHPEDPGDPAGPAGPAGWDDRVAFEVLSAGLAGQVADLVAAEAANQSVELKAPGVDPDGAVLPDRLRRPDGLSAYALVGSQRWTSQRVLDAEQQLLTAAERDDGRRVDLSDVDLAIADAALTGPALNAGQATLVRALAGSGHRLQLALAPAGTGKTTALRVLARAWTASGGTVVGLAPSAAAAAVLAEQLATPTDTLAKLVHTLTHPETDKPGWVAEIGADTLVVIDEAGLADTLSLAAAVTHLLEAGASVRLVGDDHQLGAVGAGGVLRDLDARRAAVRLDEVVRFSDPAEAAASLALREGRPEALGFYLDQRRVHVGDATTGADQLFTAWTRDRDAGRDSLMLAPTRALTAHLNARARTHRLARQTRSRSVRTGQEVMLPDGNQVSAGDTVITRTNSRTIRTHRSGPFRHSGRVERVAPDGWVRNGDRWTVRRVNPDGGLRVVSARDGRIADLPARYVAASVELGYATTVHAAQGVTCDTVHGLLCGSETRRELYTLLTRGRHANHVYLTLDQAFPTHDLDRPAPDLAPNATHLLEQILQRDGDARSAISTQAGLHDPGQRLPDEIGRYIDSLHLAAEDSTEAEMLQRLTDTAERHLPGLTDAAAWPTLRSQLLLLAAEAPHEANVPYALTTPSSRSSRDVAHPLLVALASGPLNDADDPAAVLHRRLPFPEPPTGAPLPWLATIPAQLAAHPTWGPYLQARAALLQSLTDQIRNDLDRHPPSWAAHLDELPPDQLADIAVWRAARQVPAHDPDPLGTPPTEPAAHAWHQHLQRRLNPPAVLPPEAAQLTAAADHDPFHSRLAAHLTRLHRHNADVTAAVQAAAADGPLPDDHPSAALWWRLHRHLYPTVLAAATQPVALAPAARRRAAAAGTDTRSASEQEIDTALLVAGLQRLTRPVRLARAGRHPESVSMGADAARRARLLDANRLALDYYRSRYPGSWAAQHLVERLGDDLAADERFQPGYAPAGWTNLVDHLRRHHVADDDLLDAGLATRSRRGTLIDRFRDRLVLPIHDINHDLVAFVGRRHPGPDQDASTAVPKYLNTPDTPLYSKGRHLFGGHLLPRPTGDLRPVSLDAAERPFPALVPVVVEGPLDAVAVTLASGQQHVGLATLGTALTDEQASTLARHSATPTLAFDNDQEGTAGAARAFWTLTAAGTDPQIAHLPDRTDPADLYRKQGPEQVRAVLHAAEPLAGHLERLAERQGPQAADRRLRIAAARPPHTWAASLDAIAREHDENPSQVRAGLLRHLLTPSDQPPSARTPITGARPYGPSARTSDRPRGAAVASSECVAAPASPAADTAPAGNVRP